MPSPSKRLAAGLLAGFLTIGLAACADDDGGDVRADCGSSASGGSASGGSASGGSASGGSASGAAADCPEEESATGLASEDLGAETDNQLILDAVDEYQAYVSDQIDELLTATTAFTDAVRAGDVELAKSLFAPSRAPWERIEPIAGLISDIDGAVDARVDDFANEDDPAWTGWHKLEYLLWETGDISDAGPIADQLDEDLARLPSEFPDLELPPAALAVGAAELIQEVSEGKITGEEDRYSHTDLSDFEANVQGSQVLIDALGPALEEADPDLLSEINDGFGALLDELNTHKGSDGEFVPFTDLTEEQTDALVALLAPLSENLALVAGTLELE